MKVDGFASLEELYNRCKPALKSKLKDLTRVGIDYVQIADIWNYLRINLWNKKTNLTLGEVVNDIMNVSNVELEIYVRKLFSQNKRVVEDASLL